MAEESKSAEPKEVAEADNNNDTFQDAVQDVQPTINSNEAKPQPAVESEEVENTDHSEVLETAEVLFTSEDVDGLSQTLRNAEIKDTATPTSPPLESTAKRKFFGWLSRNSSNDPALKSPPIQPRRDTATSMLSAESGSEANKAAESHEDVEKMARRIHRNSLKDRFKFVRMREEAGIVSIDDPDGAGTTELRSRPQSIQDASNLVMVDSEVAQQTLKRRQSSVTSPTSPQSHPLVNDNLPPGSAAGTSTGPMAVGNEAVDWDLWQEVVYEGPAAVARTSSDELSLAIRRGIPSAIRGVVWQVLAQSKNEELEEMYKDLVARGRNDDLKPQSTSRPSSADRRPSDVASPIDGPKESGTREETSNDTVQQDGTERSSISEKELPELTPSQSSIVSDGQPSIQQEASPLNGTPLASPTTSHTPSFQDNLPKIQTDLLPTEQKTRKDRALSLQKLEKAIKRDLGTRTSFSKFLMSAGLQDGLFGICKAYALFDEEVGYAQGMNFIAMPLLFNMPEEEAFCLFVRLMNQYHLRDLFVHDMPGLHLHLYQFERLLEDFEPALYCHLHRRGVQPQLYATQWFLTLFAYRFPLQLVLRIYDLILSEGLESAILKLGIVLMQKNTKTLLEMKDMAALTNFLKDRLFDVYIDKSPSASSLLESGFFGSATGIDKEVYRADALVEDACAVPLTPEMLKLYTKEWNEKVQDEKERAAELENLRLHNAKLTSQIRQMSQRAETQDKEHVSLASDLVHTKIANQTLTDQNESLTHQITELQAIIAAQPGEVEERLRAEMERIMTRNAEVQHENRALEEQCTEMEGELANAKMKVAEMDSELENMRSRWRSMEGVMSGLAK